MANFFGPPKSEHEANTPKHITKQNIALIIFLKFFKYLSFFFSYLYKYIDIISNLQNMTKFLTIIILIFHQFAFLFEILSGNVILGTTAN